MVFQYSAIMEYFRAFKLSTIQRFAVMVAYGLLGALIVIYLVAFGIVLLLIVVAGNLLLPPVGTVFYKESQENDKQ